MSDDLEHVEDFSDDAAEFRCLVPFPDGSASFVHGFEAGMIWQRMVAGEEVIGGLEEIARHAENISVFRRMADAMGYDAEIATASDNAADEWCIVTFTKRKRRFGVIEGGKQ